MCFWNDYMGHTLVTDRQFKTEIGIFSSHLVTKHQDGDSENTHQEASHNSIYWWYLSSYVTLLYRLWLWRKNSVLNPILGRSHQPFEAVLFGLEFLPLTVMGVHMHLDGVKITVWNQKVLCKTPSVKLYCRMQSVTGVATATGWERGLANYS